MAIPSTVSSLRRKDKKAGTTNGPKVSNLKDTNKSILETKWAWQWQVAVRWWHGSIFALVRLIRGAGAVVSGADLFQPSSLAALVPDPKAQEAATGAAAGAGGEGESMEDGRL